MSGETGGGLTAEEREALCEQMHYAYEDAAAEQGWETQERSRVLWADVPEANKATMRAMVRATVEPRLADANARLAAVEALRARWEGTRDGALSPGLRTAVDDLDREWFQITVARRGREVAALHPDTSEAG